MKLTVDQIVKGNIVVIDGIKFVVETITVYTPNQPYLTTVESKKQQEECDVDEDFMCAPYTSKHLRKKKENFSTGIAVFANAQELVDCVNSGDYYIG